jgi:hypothetical protein
MTRRPMAVLLTCTAVLTASATAVADGGRSSWPATAPLAGAWSGTASSTSAADFTFPVTASVAVSATGRPTGVVRLGDPINCSARWIPVSTSGRATVFSESIAANAGDKCVNNGTVRLSSASDGRLRYVWRKGDAGSVGYLEPRGLSGWWTGRITQDGLGAISARIRVVGVRPGQMAGASDYSAPLSCGGTLVPRGGTQQRAVFDEEIARSSSTVCVGSGTTTLALRADGRMDYRWTGGGAVSVGVLRRAG